MKNFLKGIGYMLPALLFCAGSVYFCMHEPMMVVVMRIVAVVFYALIVSIFYLFIVALVAWSLKNTLMHIFKVKFNILSKK